MSKVFLITGAGRGLGADIARQALAAGHQVVATGRGPERVIGALGGEQDDLSAAPVSTPHSPTRTTKEKEQRHGAHHRHPHPQGPGRTFHG
jgi:NAD(P)-dependent dehydrogenase (short-subunit alcohol dehydrogenase family)